MSANRTVTTERVCPCCNGTGNTYSLDKWSAFLAIFVTGLLMVIVLTPVPDLRIPGPFRAWFFFGYTMAVTYFVLHLRRKQTCAACSGKGRVVETSTETVG